MACGVQASLILSVCANVSLYFLSTQSSDANLTLEHDQKFGFHKLRDFASAQSRDLIIIFCRIQYQLALVMHVEAQDGEITTLYTKK